MNPRQHLRPPPHHRPSGNSSPSNSGTSTPSAPRAPPAKISADPSATISDSAYFAGPYQITIAKGAVIHPRTRICATEGPVRVGEGVIVSEKAIIGTYPAPTPGEITGNSDPEKNEIVLSPNVIIGIQVLVHPGVRVNEAAVVDNQVVVGRGSEIGAHAKVCARTELVPGARVKEWTVVFGGGKGVGIRSRRKAQKKVVSPFAGANPAEGKGKGFDGVMEGGFVEDARLLGIKRERDALGRLIVGVKRK